MTTSRFVQVVTRSGDRVRPKSPIDDWNGGWAPGPESDRRDYASFADFGEFADPEGNTWVLQEIGFVRS